MEIKKIKHTKSGGTEIKYYLTSEDENEVTRTSEHTVKTKDEPRPEFKEAMQKLAYFVKWDESITGKKAEVNITGVTLFEKGDTAIITHTKIIKTGTTARNSGRISNGEDAGVEVQKLFEHINNLVTAAVEFVNGQRAQLNIFSEGQEEQSPGPKKVA